jgi:hypothetical protein
MKYDEIHFYLFYFIFILLAACFFSFFLLYFYSPSIKEKILRFIDNKRIILIILLCSLCIILFVRFIVLYNSVVTDDEYCYYFISQTLLKGRLYNASHPLAEFFNNNDIINNGKWYGFPTIGYPLILSPGVAVNLPWLINPLISVLLMYLIILIAKQVFNQKVAVLSAVLLLFSPMFIFLGSTNLPYPTIALLVSLLIYSVIKFLHTNNAFWSILIGAILVMILFVRPIDCSIISIALTILLFKEIFIPFNKDRFKKIVIAIAIALIGFLAFLYINYLQNGSPFTQARDVYFQGRAGFGIGSQSLTDPPYIITVSHALKNILKNLIRENFWLLGWPISLLFFIFCRLNKWSIFLFVYIAVHIFFYSMYYSSGQGFMGPFYYYMISPFILLLSASGIIAIAKNFNNIKLFSKLRGYFPAFIMSLVLFNITIFLPIQCISLHNMVDGIQLMNRTVKNEGISNAIIFVMNIKPPKSERTSQKYFNAVYGMRNNSPDLDDNILYVRHLGVKKDAELLKYFPDKNGYIYRLENKEPILTEIILN